MNRNEIKEKLDQLYADAKSKGFVSHLVKAYLPISKIVKVLDKPKEGRLVCVLTGQKLITVSEILSTVQSDEFKQSLNSDLKVSFEGNIEPTAMTKVLSGKVLGFTGVQTTTYVSYTGIQALLEWVADKIASNDGHVKWLVGATKPDKPKGTFQKKTQAENNGYRKPSSTFGDLGVLQNLKSQLLAEEKSR